MYDEVKACEEFLAARRKYFNGRLDEDELLLNAFEAACAKVVDGAEPETPEFSMYSHGRRLILARMKS